MRLFALFALLLSFAAHADDPPKIGHVFVIVLENEDFETTFGANAPARYLAQELPKQGAMLDHYYGIGHNSLDNYIAMISGQGPNPVTQADCQIFAEFALTGWAEDGQAVGQGCVYPASVRTLANQMEDAQKGLRWHGYMEDMGKTAREMTRCAHPAISAPDETQKAAANDKYAARHDPFVYFHSLIDTPSCAANVVPLDLLEADLADPVKTPNFSFITPNLCNDGHDNDTKCGGKDKGGLKAADAFLKHWVPLITASPAYLKDGLLIITFDEADTDRTHPGDNFDACCDEQNGPNIKQGDTVFGDPDKGPGVDGPGGGRTGTVLISPFIKKGTVSSVPYNHYSLLKSLEDIFGLPYLGYAGRKGLVSFGKDVFTAPASTAH